ncbi:MAG: N-acetyltransferase [Sphingomonas fennica]
MRSVPTVTHATIPQAQAAMAVARQSLPGLMTDETLARLLDHNPEMFHILSGDGIPAGRTVFYGLMPLTEKGAAGLVAGRLHGAAPELDDICRPGEVPVAVYCPLIFTPAAFGPAMKALTLSLGQMAPAGGPLFGRPVTDHTAQLFPAMGFLRADTLYPDAPADLLVVLPEAEAAPAPIDEKRLARRAPWPMAPAQEAPAAPSPTITVRVARTMEDMMRVFAIRAATYMSEQSCPYDEEFDGNDFCAMHLIGEVDGEPAGCLRIRFFNGFVKMERLAVRGDWRTSKLAFRMVREGMKLVAAKGFTHVYGHSRADLVRFWSTFGFRPIPGRPTFTFSGLEYVEMEGAIPAAADPIAIGCDPLKIIRPEGAWDRPGPLDRSGVRGLAEGVAGRIRTVGGGRGE